MTEITDSPAAAKTGSSSLGVRVISALVLAPVVLGLTWTGGAPFLGLLIIAGPLMAQEWARLAAPGDGAAADQLGLTVGLVGFLLALGTGDGGLGLALFLGALGLTVSLALWRGTPPARPVIGFLYVGGAVAAFAWLRDAGDVGRVTIFWLLGTVWATDIGGYFVGRTIGGPKMAPKLSPNKTVSGLGGGMIAAAVFSYAFMRLVNPMDRGAEVAWIAAAVAALVALVSQAGDVFESALKRRAGVKDSGTIIPGHGGILDRVDGLMFAAIFTALAVIAWHVMAGWLS